MLILFDRSGSMQSSFGEGSRYQALAALLTSIVQRYSIRVRFGFQEMPSKGGSDSQTAPGCATSPPSIEIGNNNTQAIVSAIAAATPVEGNTPTAAALQAAHDYFDQIEYVTSNRFVLLATDGVPNCTLVGGLSSADVFDQSGIRVAGACFDAIEQVSALVASGVRVIVLGVGSDLVDDIGGRTRCLDALARAGGLSIAPGSPGFYSANDPLQLQNAIEKIFGALDLSAPSCLVTYPDTVKNDATIEVFLDGYPIPRLTKQTSNESDDGWELCLNADKQNMICITGAYCDWIQHFQVNQVEVRFDCDYSVP